MTKVVYNGCFGGFGLSDQAVLRYAELKGITLYRSYKSNSLRSLFYTDPDMKHCYSINDISRADPSLAQVVEELGDAANGIYAKLYIEDIPAGTPYRIDEYDGNESVMTVDNYEWETA